MENAIAITGSQGAGELLKHYPCVEMAKAFREGTAEIARLMECIEDQSRMMRAVFFTEKDNEYRRENCFDVGFRHNGRDYRHEDGAKIRDCMKREAWRVLVDRIGLRNIMSVRKRNEFDEQLSKGELPDITEETILDVLMSLCEQARDFAKEAAKEVFDILRPRGDHYKTNDSFRVGRRVILEHRVELGYGTGKFRPRHYREQELIAIDGVFHLLDGKGVMREHRGPLVNAVMNSPDGRGETDYFKFKCFKNHNLHLEMKRLDLVMDLNLQAVGERVLGADLD